MEIIFGSTTRQSMSIGLLGDGTRKFLRKFRWLFHIKSVFADGIGGKFCKLAARPSVSFAEAVLNHLTETITIPTRVEWQPLSITVFDVTNGESEHLYDWANKFYDFKTGKIYPVVGNKFKTDATLVMLDGQGSTVEEWTIENCWPQTINWGDLDYTSNDTADIELTLRYDRAHMERKNAATTRSFVV